MPNSLDFLGRFKNPALQDEFILYCTQQRPKISFGLITLVLLTWAISESILCTWFAEEEPDEKARQLIFGWISLILSFIVLTICILLSFPIFQFQNRFIYSYLQVIFIISINSVFIVKAIKHISFGSTECNPPEYNVIKMVTAGLPANVSQSDLDTMYTILESSNFLPDCPSSESFWTLLSDQAVLLISLCPQLLMAIIYEPRLYILWGCNFPTAALILYSRYVSAFNLLPILTFLIMIAILLRELHSQRVQSFLDQKKIQHLLEENERKADATHATEMRHMIGNVAHDLKTVSPNHFNDFNCNVFFSL